MSLNYTSYVAALANTMGQISLVDPDFVTLTPNAIDYAEQRIYRELDLQENVVRDATGVFTINLRNATLPSAQGRFVAVDNINLLVGGVRTNPLVPVSQAYIDLLYPSDIALITPSLPVVFAMVSDQNILVAPPPDGTYGFEVTGRIRPAPLSAANASTVLTTYFPDLFLAASMIFASGYQHNFGAQGDDPRQAVSWESQYQGLLQSAQLEQTRKRFAAPAYVSKRPEAPPAPQRV